MNIREKLLGHIDSLTDEILEMSNYIHKRPEEGYEEHQAVGHLASGLRSHGFTVEMPVADIPTALRAFCGGKSAKPSIGFIAEYDALPEIGHGCGHNLIAASAFGAAIGLAPFLKETGGSIYLYGTPAEESDGGKIPMLEKNVFDPIDVAIMMHPESMYMVNTSALALDALRFNFRGKASHAAATPHQGINALDAVIQLFNNVNALRQQLKPDVRVHGIISKGGTWPNIIPDKTEAHFYVRAEERIYLSSVTEKVINCAKGAAKATGCSLRITRFERSMDNIINNPVLSGVVEEQMRSLGVLNIREKDDVPGSTDFGNVSHRVPSAYFYCATAPEGTPLHTKEFARLSNTTEAHRALMLSIKVLALTALELLRKPELVKRAHELFSHRTGH